MSPDAPTPMSPGAPTPELAVAPAPVHRSGYLYWVMKVILTPVLTVAFRPRIEGVANVPRRGAAVLACNHVSYLDWLLLPLVVRTRRISFLAKEEYFTQPGLRGRFKRYFFSATGQVPVARGDADSATAALLTSQRLLGEGRLLGIFPEGTRSRDGRLNRGRTGIARLAAETGVHVVPCATVGLFAAAPAGKRLPRPRKVAVRFGPPMTFPTPAGECPTAQELRDWTDQVMLAIQSLSGQELCDPDAEPDTPV